MADKLTDQEKQVIAEALEARPIEEPRPQAGPGRSRAPLPDRLYQPARSHRLSPGTSSVPREIGVRGILEWAFSVEKASFEHDEIGASAGSQRLGVGMEYILEQRFMLGGVAIDTSPGKSMPADEAEIVASVVRAQLPWCDAILVAEHARAGTTPNWMPGAVPKLEPREWHGNRHGWFSRTADSRELGAEGWPHQPRRNRKGVIVLDQVRYSPCVWSPTHGQIAMVRRRYLDWWGHLLTLRVALQSVELRRFRVTNAMPPMTPWRAGA